MHSLSPRLAWPLGALFLLSPLACAAPLRTVTPIETAPELPPPPPPKEATPVVALVPPPPPPITVVAVGDVQLGRGWPDDAPKLPPGGAAWLLAEIQPLFAAGDVVFGNLETALRDEGESAKCKRSKPGHCYAFRAPTAYAPELAATGFHVLSLANNHAGDFGPEGRQTTIAALDAVGIRHSGPVGDVASFEVKGRKVAMVAFATGSDMHRVQELDEAKRLVEAAAATHDLVIVSFHAGAEGAKATRVPEGVELFLGEDRGDVRRFARTVIDAGADLVLGHGPHVLRGMEIYRDRLVAYSLGNFSAWESFNLSGPLGITGVLEVPLGADGAAEAVRLRPVQIERPGRPLPDPAGKAIPVVRELSTLDFGAPLLDEDGTWTRPAPVAETPRS